MYNATRDQMVTISGGMLGKPFGEGGTGPDAFDCFGLVVAVQGLLGLCLPDYRWVNAGESNNAFLKNYHSHADPVVFPGPGDVAMFSRVHGSMHCGVMIDHIRMLHCARGAGVVVSRLDRRPWQGVPVRYFRVRR